MLKHEFSEKSRQYTRNFPFSFDDNKTKEKGSTSQMDEPVSLGGDVPVEYHFKVQTLIF